MILRANGELLQFVDGDDWIEYNAVETYVLICLVKPPLYMKQSFSEQALD